ncbi:Rid family hydrolase, partial [Bacillus altitudinis]|uniref:Rid family hydrolase n=1 Tax=Bacillus altitudinis TaxID=293387 RepID=UPI003B524B01
LKPLLQPPPPSFQTLLKPTLFIKDIQQFPQLNQLYPQYFHTHNPPPSCLQLPTLPKHPLLQIQLVPLLK